jgi:hypothetical protein
VFLIIAFNHLWKDWIFLILMVYDEYTLCFGTTNLDLRPSSIGVVDWSNPGIFQVNWDVAIIGKRRSVFL